MDEKETVEEQERSEEQKDRSGAVETQETCLHMITPKHEDKLVFFYTWCKKCRLCAAICPTKAIETEKDGKPYLAFPEKCTLCAMCILICPDFAIVKNPNYEEKNASQ